MSKIVKDISDLLDKAKKSVDNCDSFECILNVRMAENMMYHHHNEIGNKEYSGMQMYKKCIMKQLHDKYGW